MDYLKEETMLLTAENKHICKPKSNESDVQTKQCVAGNYFFIGKLLASYLGMRTYYQVIAKKHIQFIFNQSQADAQKWSMRRRKEEVYLGICNYYFQTICPFSYPETDIIQYQNAFDNTFITL